MKKPTILRTLIFVLAMLFNFASYSQNLIAYNSKFTKNLNENIFLKANDQIGNPIDLKADGTNNANKLVAPPVNPAIKYAQAPYLGTVSICPNDGKQLPKLFLCGINETRKIETGIKDAQSIIWEKFNPGGSCLNVSNTNCANETAAASCWTEVGNTPDYVASTAGQFRVKIVDNTGTPYTFYFNVYQNTLDPGAIAKNDIIKYGTSCTINGKITVNGFGSGYEYGLTTTSSPPSSWQSSNVFNVTAAGSYNVFIRLAGVAGSCDFKIPNIVINSTNFAVTTQVNSPKCDVELGSIRVVASDVNLQYVYKLTGPTNITIPATTVPNYTFSDLASGTYTVETSIVGTACMKDTKNNIIIVASPKKLNNSSRVTKSLSACSLGEITGAASDGKTPYRYSISIDGGEFTPVANVDNKITVAKAGNYIVRLEDGNGCTADKAISIGAVDKPVYNISKVDGSCTGASGSISVNVTNSNGYTDIQYSIDNGATFKNGFTFTNLSQGIYYVVVQYRKAGVSGAGNAYCQDPAIITTVGAATPLSASAGIAALSGCGVFPNEIQGLARIVNPQGGVPFPGAHPYKYSFMGSPWDVSNEMFINPGGPYILRIMDAVGCIYEMPGITLDQKPAPPSIQVLDPVFNCDGSATSTVEVNGGVPDTKYSYKYYIDGFLNNNTPPNVFPNVGGGKHTITVEYTVLNVSTYSNLLIENFGSGGTTTTPGIAGTYCFNDQRVNPPYTCSLNGTPTRSVEDNQYSVTNFFWRDDDPNANNTGAWFHFKDHTTAGNATPDPLGRYLLINIGKAAGDYGVLYSKDIVDVIPNQPVMIDLYVANLLRRSRTGAAPIVIFELVDPAGNVVASDNTGKIAEDAYDVNRNKWIQKSISLNPGNNTKLTFKIRSGSTDYGGNDLVMDDIWVRQIPKACRTVKDEDITIDPSKVFSAAITKVNNVTCNGGKDGDLTITAMNFDPKKGFQYSMDNGAAGSWVTVKPVPEASSGSVTVKNLESKNYLIKVRYENIATSCTWPLSQDINAPELLKVSATVTKPATCKLGATITAVATEGTPDYMYELRAANGTTVIRALQSSGEFLDVPVGNYRVMAKDANKCQTGVLAPVTVIPAVKPQIDFESISQCFDQNTGTDITVKVSGGVGPYSYTVTYNGGTPSLASPTFVGPNFTYKAANEGTYKFKVTDSFECDADEKTITIKAQLLTSTTVTTGLDCDPAPNNRAIISGSIQGGTAPYTVSIISGATTGTLVQPVANGTSFTYSIVTSGYYKFQIKDANNCITTSEATIDPLDAITLRSNNVNPKCNGGSTGSVELLPSGGSGGFTYSRDNIMYNGISIIKGLSAGNYTFYVKDSNKCTKSINVTLTDPPAVVASASIPTNTTCSATTLITTSGAGGVGGFTYSFNGSTTFNGVNTLLVTNKTTVQTITYSVKDANDCIDTKTIDIPAYNPPVGVNISTPIAITCEVGKTTTSVTVTPKVGGIAPFTYLITAGAGTGTTNSTGIFSGLVAGSYTFQITDANGCKDSGSITIDAAATIAVSGKKTDVKCVGLTNGTATFTVTGASSAGNFTYTLTPASGTVTQLNDEVTVTGLGAGTYKLQVRDKTTKCLSNEASVTINPATAISITAATGSNVNCGNSVSNIVVSVTGGVPNYKYAYVLRGAGIPAASAFSTTNTTINTGATQSNLFWDVYVMDQNDCTAGPFNLDITRETSPTVKSPAPATFCFKAPSTTAINLSTFFNLGTGTHTYTVNGLSVSNPTNYNITSSGTYTIVAKDANGCTATATYVVNPELTILATRVKDLTCTNNAEISFTANGGSNIYSKYEVQFNAAGPWTTVTSPFSTANAGDYQFRVTDNANCQALSNKITVTAKTTPSFLHNEKQPTCIGVGNGVINITDPTGLAPFSYSIKKGSVTVSTTASTANLNAGVYDVLLTDAKGCTASAQITLNDPIALNARVNMTPLACNSDNTTKQATITVTLPTGGTGTGYEYSFNGGAFSATATYSTSIAGTVTVEMRDSNHCTQSLTSQTFAALNGPKITGFTASLITCKPGEDKSNVDITVSNGVGALSYTIVSGPTNNATGATDGKFTGLADGVYVFKVTDANGCSDTDSYTVKPKVSITASLLSQVNVACNGGSTGSAKITVSAYTGTYTATLTAGTGTVTKTGSTVDITNLAQGLYTLRVTDDLTACFKDVNFTITELSPVTLTLTSNKNANCGQSLSKVIVTAGGGKLPYSYAFRSTTGNPAAGDYVLNANTADLDPAITTWYAWVKDANGCEKSLLITIAKDPDAVVNLPAQQCFAAPFTITLSGTGKAPLEFTVNGSTLPGTTYNVTASGTYKLGVKDANGCTNFKDYVVDKQIFASAIPGKDLTCSVPTAAEITVNITNGTAPYSYQIYNGSLAVGAPVTGIATTSFTETFTSPGNYSFEVTDSKGCPVKTNALPVTATGTIVANPVTTLANCHGNSDGTVTFTGSGGKAPYKYSLDGSTLDFSNVFGGLAVGPHSYIVEDARGCRDVGTITIGQPNKIDPSFTVNDIKCYGDIPGSIEITGINDGVGPFIFTLFDDKTNTAIHTSTPTSSRTYVFPNNLVFGDYHVLIVDSKGCEAKSGKLRISTHPYLKFAPPVISGTCKAGATVNLFLDTTLPSAPNYKYSIYGDASTVSAATPATTYQFTGLKFGQTYFFQVEDSNGCFSIVEVPIAPLSLIQFTSIVSTDVSCNVTPSVANGSIKFTVSNYDPSVDNLRVEVLDQLTNLRLSPRVFRDYVVTSTTSITDTFINLPTGSYTLQALELDGTECSNATTFEIGKPLQPVAVSVISQTNDNCNADARVVVKATGGTKPYEYTFVADGALEPTGGYSSANPLIINFESGTDWDIWVKDKNGCTSKVDVSIGKDLPPVAVAGPAVPCFTGATFTVDLSKYFTTTVGAPIYTLDGVDLPSSIATITAAKTYTIGVRDGNGCTATASYVVRDILTLSPTLTKELDCNPPAPNATVTVEAQGGDNTNYTYTITAGTTINTTGATTGIFTGLDAGNYTFEVNDGACTVTATIKIDVLVNIVPAKLEINPLCIGANGSVEINATGGTGIYTYQKGAAPTLPTETINKFVQTAAEGTVTYYIKDSKGCIQTINATVTDPTPVSFVSVVVDQMLCGLGNTPNEAKITVTATGGAGGYEYSFDNGANYSGSSIFTTKISGTYNIIVKDANGCISVMRPETIDALDPPVITGFGKTQMTCPALESDVTINHSNGIGTVTYTMVSGTTMNTTGDTSGTYTGLKAGDYVFRITDSNNCTDEELVTILALPTLQMQEKVVANVGCITEKTGSATFTASDFFASGAFTYSIVTTPTGLTFTDTKVGDVLTLSDLAKGHYEVTFRDNTTHCSVTKSVDITEPALALSVTAVASNVHCNQPVSQLTMTAVGGTPNYTYSIVQSGAGAGTYSTATSIDTTTLTNGVVVGLGMTWLVDVHIKDANNCTAMTTITITKDDTPTVTTPTLASNQCIANENYTFTATGTGVAPLSFSIDGINYFESSGTTYTFTVPAPTTASQSYTVYVKDVNGCIATSTTSTIVYKPLTFKVVQDKEITCVPMPATTAAQFTLTAADGNPAYTYEVNINNAGFNSITSPYTTSVIGRYVFRVTDSNSCSVTSDVIIVDGPVDPAFTITKVDVKCNGDNTGTITVAPSGGVRPYTFALSGANANNSGDATGLYTGLRAGTYNVVVTDSYGCTSGVTPAIVITEPTPLMASASFPLNTACNTYTVITVEGSGGTPITPSTLGYLYSFDNGVTFDTSDKITIDYTKSAQTIWYAVKDANGCTTAPKSITVNPLNKPSKLDFNATLVTCKAGEDVSTVEVTATDGFGALEFRIVATNTATSPTLFGPITTTGSAVAASFPGLLPGDYTFEVKDSNGCTFQDLYTVKEKVNIAVDGQLDNGVVCKGEENGKVTFKVSNFNTGFAHTITGVNAPGIITPVGTDTFVLTNLAVGSYTINVTDNVTNCVASFTVDVPEPDALELDYKTLKNANCTDLAKIKATASKGTAGYTYAFVKAGDPVVYGTEDTAELDKAFTWRVWAKDSHGCERFKDINILVDASPVIVSAIPNHCPSTTGTYDITVTANGFNANLEYSLDGNSWGTNKVLVVKSSGAHIVYVRDENKCTANQTVTILEPLRLEYDIIETPICEGNQGEVTLRAYGGTVAPSYEYSKDGINFDPNPIFNGLVPGNYTFTVRDTGTGCTKEVEVKFEIPNKSIIFSLEPTNVICNGESNGTVTVNMATPTTTANNNPVYTYKINPSPVGMVLVGNVFTNLPADTYTVTVTSGKGCEVPMTVIVGQPALIIVDTPIVSNYGCATDNKTIYATITVDKTKITGGSKNYTRFQFVKTSNANEIVYDGTSNIYTESDFLGGKYVVNVFDNKGCMGASTEVEILPFTSMDKIDVVITPITCATNEAIAVKVKDFNGVTFTIPLEYKLDGVGRTVFSETNTNGVFTNLPIGHYLISVKNTATGCVIKKDHFVNDPNTFRLTAENVTNIKCYGVLEGSVDLILTDNLLVPTNDAGEFKYEIKDVAGTLVKDGTSDATGKATINGLKAGLYNVKAVLSKTPFCEVVTSFSIQQPITELKISEIHAPISCIPGNDGKIVISADGGWPGGYQYELVGVSTGYSDQSEFSNLSAGTYILNVKDSKGCVATTTVTLNNPTPIAATATATTSTLLCYGDKTGVITVSAPTGGQGSNYAYILNLLSVNPVISTASQDSPIFTGLGAGKYSVTIVDQLNCNGTTAEVIIGEPLEIIPTLELATGITCKTAATLKLSAIGGSGPYEYSSDKNFTTVLGSLPATFAVGVGDHQYFVRDSKGCVSSISNNVTIDALTPLTLKLDLTNAVVYCKGSATAAIDAEAIGGLTNYVYTLFDGNGVVVRPAQPTGYFDLLPKGVYVVRVDSGDCQYDSASININEPAQPLSVIPTVIDATCFASNDGKISIAATGGTGVIKYAISPNLGMFDDKFEFDRLTPGVYQVLVQDENSCFQLLNLEIKEPPLLGAKVVGPILQEICDGDIDGAFSIEIFGGKPPYSVSLDNENGTYIPVVGTQHDFVALKGGRHTVYIKDATCISTLEVIMDKAVILDPIAETNYDCVNNAQTNMVTVTVDASNTDLTQVDYSLDSDVGPWQAANIFTNIAPGKHYIVARHTNGCKVPTTSFEIRAYDKLTLGESEGKPEMNIISVTAAGGAPAYEYSFNGEPFTSSNKYKIYKTGDYEVIVRDQNGCTATTTVHAIYVDVCLDNYFTPNGDGVYDTWGPGCTNIYNNLVFSIFDRYGRVIAKYHYGQKWDGRYNGAELPSGDYWYVLKLNDEKDAREFVGHFTLYR